MKPYVIIRRNWRFKPLWCIARTILVVVPSMRLATVLSRAVCRYGFTITFTDKDPAAINPHAAEPPSDTDS